MYSLLERTGPFGPGEIEKKSHELDDIKSMVHRAKFRIFEYIYINDQRVDELAQLTKKCKKILTHNDLNKDDNTQFVISQLYEFCSLISVRLGKFNRYSNYFAEYVNAIMRLNRIVYRLSAAYEKEVRPLVILTHIDKIADQLLDELEFILNNDEPKQLAKIPPYFEALNKIARNKFIPEGASGVFDCRYHACIYKFSMLSQDLLQEYYSITTSSTAVFFKRIGKKKGIPNSDSSFKKEVIEQLLPLTKALPKKIHYCDTTEEYKNDKLAFTDRMEKAHERFSQVIHRAYKKMQKSSTRDFETAFTLTI